VSGAGAGPPDQRPWIPPPPPLELDTPIVLPDLPTLKHAAAALRTLPSPPIRRKPHMPDRPKPKVTDLIRREANVAEANQNPVAAHELRKIADEMDNSKNGSVPPEQP
jgi:hypothetical protein